VPKALRGFESFIRCQKQFTGFGELLFLLAAWHQNPNKTNQISARSAEGASRVRILHPLPKQFTGFGELFFYYGLHFPHGEYPEAIASSRV